MVFVGAARRVAARGFGVAAIAGVMMLFGPVGAAPADPSEPVPPPNCTAADAAGVASQVGAATQAYLLAHPDVNDFFTGLRGKAPDEMRDDLDSYMNANPQVHSDLEGIRQPVADQQQRCQQPE